MADASGRHFMLKNPRAQTYARLSPEEFWVWQRLDGEHTVRQLVLAYFMENKCFAFGAIVGMLEHLRASKMLNQPPRQLYSGVSEQLKQQGRWRRIAWLIRSALTREFVVKGLDSHLDRMHRKGGWLLYTWPVQLLFLLTTLVGLYLFIRLSADPGRNLLRWDIAIQLGLLSYIPLAIHELGHALTAKHVGCDVYRGGIMLYYGLPAAFVETTDLWMFGKRERLVVTWAGPYTGYILGGACSILVYFFPAMPAVLSDALLRIALVGVIATSINLLPVFKLDGYYLLSDALEMPRLRERSLDFLTRKLWGRVREPRGWTREEVIFIVFGVLAVASTVYFARAGVEFWDRQTTSSVSELLDLQVGLLRRLGSALKLVLGISIIGYSLYLLGRVARRAATYAQRKGLLARRGRAAAVLGMSALAITLLPPIAMPTLSRWLVVLTGLIAFGLAAWLALSQYRAMRGSLYAHMWALAMPAFALGALAFTIKIAARSMGRGVAVGVVAMLLAAGALLSAWRLLRGLWGGWRFLSMTLIELGILGWGLGLVSRPIVQTFGGLLILGGLLHWRIRPQTEIEILAGDETGSTRARMSRAAQFIRERILAEVQLDYGPRMREWVETGRYRTKRKDVGRADFASTVPGMTPDDYGSTMALAIESLLCSVERVAGTRYMHHALAFSFDRLDWESQEIAEDHLLKYVPQAEGLSTALAETRGLRLQLIRSVPLFAGMTDLEQRALAGEFQAQVFERGENLVRAGIEAESLYLVRAGRVEVLGLDGRRLDVLSRGDYFGEAALLAHQREPSGLRALTPVEVLRLDKYQFDRLIRSSADLDGARGATFERLRVLRQIPLFVDFDARDLMGLAGRLEQVEVPQGTKIFGQGDEGDSFYVIEAGSVSVEIDRVERATLGPGEYFGEIALLTDAPRTASIIAREPTMLLRMRADDFRGMINNSDATRRAADRASSRRVLSNERWLREVAELGGLQAS